ncbi:acyltransferase [Caldanaerobius polysaccharolyticus]|uniref:acyltransferase n=1 Tax=Caldanaerobius polysaccharolyticus TaxID=44256 RepID=UPI00146F9B8A
MSKNVRINKGAYIGGKVIIGENSYVNYNSIIETGVIGKYCSISPDVIIGMDEHPYNLVSTHP